ncbi:NADH:flavin oxidoreductase/NADH oxidase [Rhodococcus rhodochrous]|uniref:Oxidoreductase n=1 Tax=Rhodococcus rhodochrous KG-21 TaxID=1441923 RepID=A0A0M8PK66_RHORH|nr:NADH:flavin oxidoreductase/NADH oxidase [Rhodococcus rhodochrous]KOS56605.1 oxidoreductase [Rhodococcus rhodochrous KG-21]
MSRPAVHRTRLFSPLTLRGVTFRNRLWVAPMCQFSADDGIPDDWHLVHLGSFAKGKAGLVLTEATAVSPDGRISRKCTGLWNDTQREAFARINRFVTEHGSIPGIQLAHAGRKASAHVPWEGDGTVPVGEGGWETVGPSATAWGDQAVPREMTVADIAKVVTDFADAAVRALAAGFRVVEIHAAHGYLLHQFLSPITNRRTDGYGGDPDRRARLLREVVAAVRAVWPEELPLFLRISATDWVEDGWDVDDSVALIRSLEGSGIDLVDVSSGGLTPEQQITVGPGYQVPFARRIRSETALPVAAVGLITDSSQAEQVLVDGAADAVFVGRNLLREPMWPLKAAKELGVEDTLDWPAPYRSARYRGNIP